MWMPVEHRLVEIQAWPAESVYFSDSPQSPDDLTFQFLDFMAQRANFSGVEKPTLGLHDDLFNLCASLAKIDHLHQARKTIGSGVSRMIVTEVEFLFSICRSIFDLLQEIIAAIWDSIQLHDSTAVKKPLKDTFSSMVQFEGRTANSHEISTRFCLPGPLADYYVRHADFFLALRQFRDNVIHRGSVVQTIFSSDDGFLIRRDTRPFSKMRIWSDDEASPTGLVPLSPAIGMLIYQTLVACEDFSSTIVGMIQFPPPIAPGMFLFARSYFNAVMSATLRDARGRLERASIQDQPGLLPCNPIRRSLFFAEVSGRLATENYN